VVGRPDGPWAETGGRTISFDPGGARRAPVPADLRSPGGWADPPDRDLAAGPAPDRGERRGRCWRRAFTRPSARSSSCSPRASRSRTCPRSSRAWVRLARLPRPCHPRKWYWDKPLRCPTPSSKLVPRRYIHPRQRG